MPIPGRRSYVVVLTSLCLASCGGGDGGGSPGDDAGPSDDAGVVVDAGSDAGGPTNDLCAGATLIDALVTHASLSADVVGASADLAAPCGTAGTPDVFFRFQLGRRELVYADTFGAAGSGALFFASACATPIAASTTPGDAVCSSGACGTSQARVVALLDPGTYYLVYAGQASATIRFERVGVGTGSVAQLAVGASTVTGTTSGAGGLAACDALGPENAYWWTSCPSDAGGTLTASTCTDLVFDTMLSVQNPGADSIVCDDDSCGFGSTISTPIPAGAGIHVVAVDGFSAAKSGAYTLTVTRP